jgi:tetratricopeptide (TPR) repeat protein
MNKPDNSQLFVLERYADNIERSLKKIQNAKLFVESDEVTFRLWVRKYIYNRFENIEIINKDMLNASWYSENKKDITYYIENNFDVFCDTDPEFFRYYSLPYGILYRQQKNFSQTDLSLWEDILLSEGDERITLREIEIIKDRYPVVFNDIAFQLALEGKYYTAEDFLNLAIERDVNPQYVLNLNIIKKREDIFKDEIEKLIYFRRFEEAEKLLSAHKDIPRYAEFLYRLKDFNKLGDFKELPDFYKGVLLFNKNKYSDALEFFNKSSHIDRSYYIALIFYKIGLKQKSIEILEKHIKVFPEDKKVNELLLRLKGYISVVGKGR